MFGAFFIKLPIYLFHVWLPRAHVKAPVYGSILLAAILFKFLLKKFINDHRLSLLIHWYQVFIFLYFKILYFKNYLLFILLYCK